MKNNFKKIKIMINTSDYKIVIKFHQDLLGLPYYEVFRNDEPCRMNIEDYKELGDVFDHLSFDVKLYVEEMEKTALALSLKH